MPLSSIPPDPERQRHARAMLLERILDRARSDDRVLAVLDYGSASEGRGDAWSDIDLALSIRPDAWSDFKATWEEWLAECGPLLLSFISSVGHPWAVLGSAAAPVRVDLHLYGGPPDDDLVSALGMWPNAPASVDAMLLFDRDEALTGEVERLVGKSLAPADEVEVFRSVAAHFWYYVHRTWAKMQRDSAWDVRWNITSILMGNLCALLRLESGAVERWTASDAAAGIEYAIGEERLHRLNSCIPERDSASLGVAFREIIDLGADVCSVIATRWAVPWPDELARTMQA